MQATLTFLWRSSVLQDHFLYSTYIGGADFDRADGIAMDPEGDIYITGRSLSGDYPLRNAFQIPTGGFVTKLNASGSALVYSTFLDNFREGWGIAVDSSGSAYVAGPGTEPVWVHRLNAEGSGLVYSTEIGGSQYDFFLNRGRIALDAAGNAYVTGHTSSPSFRTTNALQPVMAGTSDAFVAKLNGTGTLAYSTFLGGSGGEEGLGIAADAAGNAYITGWTTSADFPTANPLYEATAATSSFIAKLDSSGSFLSFSTSVPGASPVAIAVDAAQAIYATGGAESQGIPVSNALQSTYAGGETDAFVMKIGSSAETAETTFATNEGGGISQVAHRVGRYDARLWPDCSDRRVRDASGSCHFRFPSGWRTRERSRSSRAAARQHRPYLRRDRRDSQHGRGNGKMVATRRSTSGSSSPTGPVRIHPILRSRSLPTNSLRSS